jgi:hypothetical protein
MPFLYAVGVNNTRKNFKLIYYFLPGKIKGDYDFAIRQIYLLYSQYNVTLKVIIMDKEQALKNALRQYFWLVP